jgi:hypothetical protein
MRDTSHTIQHAVYKTTFARRKGPNDGWMLHSKKRSIPNATLGLTDFLSMSNRFKFVAWKDHRERDRSRTNCSHNGPWVGSTIIAINPWRYVSKLPELVRTISFKQRPLDILF